MPLHIRLTAAVALALILFPGSPAHARTHQDCASLPGAAEILARPGLDFLLQGESHGTVEMPAIFGDLVCAAIATSRPLVVAIEWLPENQRVLDRFLMSEDDDAALAALHAAPAWHSRDGRASAAMAAMLQQVRRLRVAGTNVRLLAFDDDSAASGTSAIREATMGFRLLQAHDAEPATLVLALTGLGHADKTGWQSQTPPFQSMVQHLPAGRTLSLAFIRGGGSVWHCQSQRPDAQPQCGVTQGTPRETIPPRGIRIDSTRAGFDGVVSAGRPYSASTPFRHPGDDGKPDTKTP